jgi:glutamate racemase
MALDWGIGGLPFFQSLGAALPGVDMLYLSDSGSVPYGKQSPKELRGRLEQIAAFAAGLGIEIVAVACNAMSSVLPAACSRAGGIEVFSLIHAFLASPLPPGRVIGLIGGIRTIRSGLYQRALEGAGNRVHSRPAQKLSALIEAGDFAAIPAYLKKILAALGDIDTLVLACTHYPAASPIIKHMAPGLEIIDPGAALLEACLRRIAAAGDCRSAGGRRTYATTGDVDRSRLSAETAFGFSGLPFTCVGPNLNPADISPGSAPA